MNKVLVTGGAGYIGSHTIVELLNAGYEIVVLDNLSNSSTSSLERIETITGKRHTFIRGDVRDSTLLGDIFKEHSIDTVLHFAGLKAVGESVEKPLEYYDNNVIGSIKLINSMRQHNIKIIIFSSSSTVYGAPDKLPINESMPTRVPTNPYGMSKLMIENILGDLYTSDPSWRIARLRYFNPVGAHKSGLIGEDPAGTPNNLMPLITQTALGKIPELSVFGGDYPTPDGSAIRDYIHVVDLAKGHLAALKRCQQDVGMHTFNLGTGRGYSVLEMIRTFEHVNNVKVPFKITDRRAGDIPACYADVELAKHTLGWIAELGIDEMCRDSWNWQNKNPNGLRQERL
jgi:UDP-glucose 4-epimerase